MPLTQSRFPKRNWSWVTLSTASAINAVPVALRQQEAQRSTAENPLRCSKTFQREKPVALRCSTSLRRKNPLHLRSATGSKFTNQLGCRKSIFCSRNSLWWKKTPFFPSSNDLWCWYRINYGVIHAASAVSAVGNPLRCSKSLQLKKTVALRCRKYLWRKNSLRCAAANISVGKSTVLTQRNWF